ncbi:Mcm3ap [Gossypium arboreum]|uniref:Mcm3ap n=1 Tax=Gossypium arboreum TaxID=29729 RepID=A0A0B0MWA7_GOSAR|nr:Mcm3ap [Gossypium arboreum]
MSGFGKHSGPTTAPKSANPFQFQRPPPPSSTPPIRRSSYTPSSSPPIRPSSYTPSSTPPIRPSSYTPPSTTPIRPSRVNEAADRVWTPLSAFENFGPALRPYQYGGVQRPMESSPRWDDGKIPLEDYDAQSRFRPPVVTSFAASQNPETSFTAKARFQESKSTKSPPTVSIDDTVPRNSSQTILQRHNPVKLPANYPNFPAHQDRSMASPHLGSADYRKNFVNEVPDMQVPKQGRLPSQQFDDEFTQEHHKSVRNGSKRPSGSPPRLGTKSISPSSNFPIRPRSLPSARNDPPPTVRNIGPPVSKRTRSPLIYHDDFLQESSTPIEDDTERELQAKAKRLARFKTELSETVETKRPDIADQRLSTTRFQHNVEERKKHVGEQPMDSSGESLNDLVSFDFDGTEASRVIIGLCPDMCPESERAERERKGDLDQYERVDGDRNQTSESLAVKKIRLHIIAMHELCEYTKGEGFSEGFDAHLNIEQMNKTSVELFQMYDDHRKKGINVPTEKEFRGYYALLKLDKHPGYKVEPAELSLDLAKMTPEIRQTPEVLFARNVARACRTGNFVAFFRLVRKASYLQACLMHAHFAKLRTQAFASLHSSLQNNQGLPISHVAEWLGIEEEDIESILDYYGFSIKEFEEPYMVKDGSFLNAENDYPTKCSRLVHQKRSRTIALDVATPHEVTSLPIGASKESQPSKAYKQRANVSPSPKRKSSVSAADEELPDSKVVPSPKSSSQLHLVTETSKGLQQLPEGHLKSGASKPFNFSMDRSSPRSFPAKVVVMEKSNNVTVSSLPDGTNTYGMEQMPPLTFSQASQPERSPSGRFHLSVENPVPQSMAIIDNVKSSPVRSPSGKYTENTLPQTMDLNDLKSQSERPSVKYDKALENSVPQGMEINDLGDKPLDDHQEIENQQIVANIQRKEVAEAKLKLILRLWSRRAAKQRELREQRQLAAEAALSSLPLGIPVRQNNDQWSTFDELDFDHVMSERCEKYERSWSRLNVSDVVSSILGQRNPDAKCLCWKIILCSPESSQGEQPRQNNQVGHLAAGPWLFSKIMPSTEDNNDDDLAITSPGMSIWKKWVPSLCGTDLTCCLSVVKDANCDNLDEVVSGANAVLFIVSQNIPWKLQKAKLYSLLNSVPPGACLPLLVLSGSYNVEDSDPSSVIVNELGLHEIDKSRVSCFLVVFLVGKWHLEHSNGFFSDEKLREGLKWLADKSPLQPVLSSVKMRELVMSHLSPVLEELDKMGDYEVGPNHCISVFNEALDWSFGEITAAIKANPTNWPCPEAMLLKDFSDEFLAAKLFLPSVGWSSPAKTAPLEHALKDCRLARFPDDISLLQRGSMMGKDIDNHRLLLENCLVEYLTQSTKMMGIPLATKETSVMIQRNTRLELRNLSYYLVPNWITIFRRIFNWRLSSLSTGACSFSYVLQTHHVPPLGDLLKLPLEVDTSPNCLSHPSLDEILEVGCSPLKSRRINFDPQPSQDKEDHTSQKNGLAITGDVACTTSKPDSSYGKMVVAGTETDRLSQLLEKCNIVQNSIGEKLSIYF